MCRVIKEGDATRASIVKLSEEICPDVRKRPDLADQAALERAAEALLDTDATLGATYRLFLAVNGILLAVALVGRFFPPLRVAQLAASTLQPRLQGLISRVEVQRAANMQTYEIIRQTIAANEAFFRLAARGG